MAYRPPHRRERQPARLDGSSAPGNHAVSGIPPRYRGGPSSNRGDSILSPASDLRPMRRTPDVKLDEMDMIQSISRSGGDGAEGDALKDHGVQSRFRAYIDERDVVPVLMKKMDKHYGRFGALHTAPKPDRTDEIESLTSIVLLLRKLREGVVASGRIDDFAMEVFETSVRLTVLANHHGQLMSSLSGLVPGLYLAVDEIKGKRKADPTRDLVDRMDDLGLSARVEFASILLLYHLSQATTISSFLTSLQEITDPPVQRLHPKFRQTVSFTTRPLLRRDQLSYAVRASQALSSDRFDPIGYFRLLEDTTASAYERIVLSWAEERVRDRAWEVLRRAYISTEMRWAERVCGLATTREGWLVEKGAKLEGTVVRLR